MVGTWLWDVPDPPIFRILVRRAQTVLRERFGVDNLRFYRSNIISWIGPREAPTSVPLPWTPRSLHGDTNTDEMFIYTTILYLSQHGDDCVGGETGIADEVRTSSPVRGAAGVVSAGLRVQPSIGRLLVFSSGVENMHEMLPVVKGKRVAVQMWFACENQDPGWARDQRAAWAEQYGFGGPDPGGPHLIKAPAVSGQLRAAKPWSWR